MDIKSKILKETFQSEFSNEKFIRFIKEFFNTLDEVNQRKVIQNDRKEYASTIKAYSQIATYRDDKKNKIGIYSIELNHGKSIEQARSLQRNFISKLLLENGHDAAIAAFYCHEDTRWRLSFVRLDYEFANGKVNLNLTPAKRYSYLVGRGEPCHTAMSQLYPIFKNENYNPTLDSIEAAFSVESVTKDFFDKYKEKFLELKEYLDNNSTFQNTAKLYRFSSEQFAKKLMGQLSFLYFLQKKGWLGVEVVPDTMSFAEYQKLVTTKDNVESLILKCYENNGKEYILNYEYIKSNLFLDSEADKLASLFIPQKWGDGKKDFIRYLFTQCMESNSNFFDEYLQPLFYEALNKKRGKNNYYKRFNCKIPFLNGGLFEPLDGYDWINSKFEIPNEIFSNIQIKGDNNSDGILDIFDRYNFTMNEDEPLEREVAVDPEMLGKIFENLLEITDRKSKGAFYTPREIVHYMCSENLINYLVKKTEVPYDDIKQFVLYGEIMKDADCYNKTSSDNKLLIPETVYTRLRDIDIALENIKIADPAVGSGAFPLGMLSEIVKIRSNITEYYIHQLNNTNLNHNELDLIKRQRALVYKEREPYLLKWQTIKNSIYAVDIEPSAVDIAKLRLYLSLVVDEELEPTEEERYYGQNEQKDPQPLPNLDCNILCGNSLIDEFQGIKLFDEALLVKKKHKTNYSKADWQLSLFGDNIGKFLDDLFKLQDTLYGEEDTNRKESIKRDINHTIDCIIQSKLTKDKNIIGLEKYDEIRKNKIKPYFLWKLEFARIFKEGDGFDIVIGNPPYGAKFSEEEKKFLLKKYPTVPDYESADFFIDMSRDLLCENGILSYIVPNMFMANVYAKKYRKTLLENWRFIQIDNLSDIDVFDTAKVRNVIVFLEKNKSDFSSKMTKLTLQNNNVKVLKQKELSKKEYEDLIDNWLNVLDKNDEDISIIKKVQQNGIALGKGICDVSQGLIPYDKYRGHSPEIIKNRIWHSTYQKDDTYKMELAGKDVSRYSVNWGGKQWISYGEWLAAPREQRFFTEERILIREITNPRIFAAYCNEEYYNTPSIINCINFSMDIYYVLGIINSKLMTYYHLVNSPKAKKGLFPKILVTDVRKMPIAKGDSQTILSISNLVKEIIALKERESDYKVEMLEEEIDRLVYKAYGLTENEIEVVEKHFS